jgi:GAF domain-containing protein
MSENAETRQIGEVLAEWSTAMADFESPEQILDRLGNYCTELLGIHGVGVLLKSEKGDLEVATANTEAGKIVEGLEAELREGPCTESLASGEQLHWPDLALAADRYPRFVPKALEAGVRSIHALPMTIRSQVVGSVDIIHLEVLDLDAAQLATAQLLADVTISFIGNSRAFQSQSRLAAQLQSALDTRVIIEQAKGILSERRGTSVSAAFEHMRRYARNNGLKLHDVAGAIVRRDLDL